MGRPALSILMSCYNTADYLEDAVMSIIQQTFEDWELLVRDDGSVDNSWELLQAYKENPKVRISRNTQNKGKTATINDLYKQARGTFVSIHDADDISHPMRFKEQIDFMYNQPNFIMCGCSFESFTNGGFTNQTVMSGDFSLIKKEIVKNSQFHGPTMVIRKRIIDEDLKGEFLRPFFKDYNEDCDLAIRLTEKGPCTNLTSILYQYRILPHSLSKSITPRKKCLYDMLVYFHDQRVERGFDDLQVSKLALAEQRLEELILKKYSDPSLIYRQQASFFMHYQWKWRAINAAWQGVMKAPGKAVNWGTLQHCVRKLLIGI